MTHINGNWMNDDQREAAKSESLFPIMDDRVGQRRGYIPMALIRRHNDRAKLNHDQSVNRLRERGGLSPQEAMAVLANKSWSERPYRDEELAWAALQEIVKAEFPDFDCESGEIQY
ncbi:MAG: hypothetical protein MI923_15995 [Phycisphaerales bacterium]|nr:hypothetical protein [Phycisphaerales bacterium]